MKRVINRSTPITIEDMFASLINEAMICGYDVIVTGDENEVPDIRIAPKQDFTKMPTFDVSVEVDGNGDCTFNAKITFPDLDTSKFTSADDAEYWAEKWKRASRIATALLDTKYNIHDLEEYRNEFDEDNEVSEEES